MDVENVSCVNQIDSFETQEGGDNMSLEVTNFIPAEHKEKISECLAELDVDTKLETNIDDSDLEFFHRNEFRKVSWIRDIIQNGQSNIPNYPVIV